MKKIIEIIKQPTRILCKLPFISDKQCLKWRFKQFMGKELDLDNPKTFNEKIQWLKLYNRKDEYVKMVDKYEAKKYVGEIIGDKHIVPTLAVYDSVDEIDISELPDKFVLKATHDSGSVIVVKDKNKMDFEAIKSRLSKALKNNFYSIYREWIYKGIKPRIIAEKYMEDENNPDGDIIDYKWYCFNGEVKCLYVSQGLSDHSTASISFFDMEFNQLPFRRRDYKACEEKPKKPKKYDEMIEMAKILSKDIPFLRVDLYEINGEIYFSELTFYPTAGYMPFEPEEWDYKMGEWLKLPNKKIC